MPAAGSIFAGWSGACSGTGTCALAVTAATTVTAMFNRTPVAAAPSPLATEPGNPSVTLLAANATGVTFRFAWTAGADATAYRYLLGFDDGSGPQQGTTTGLSVNVSVPYHASGAASAGFVCLHSVNAAGLLSAGVSCSGLAVPARP
jgi:hypothetical protein